jgi:RluA family pseudouridine synthase
MKRPIEFKVAGPEKGLGLAAVLQQRLKLSGRQARRLVDTRQVFVNQQRVWMARHVVATGDRIEVHAEVTPDRDAAPPPCPILWQDDAYLIIDKPAGWLANGPASIESRLSHELGREVFAVHRLDRDTSGCMLLAWSKRDRELMIPVFQRRAVKKIYEGIVIGRIPPGIEVINRPVGGEEAETHLKILRKHHGAARIEFTLITGRTHQIRRHLTSHGLYLAGEKQYGATVLDAPMLRTLKRHMLHAKQLGFPHPHTEQFVQARAPLPPDYREVAATLGV